MAHSDPKAVPAKMKEKADAIWALVVWHASDDERLLVGRELASVRWFKAAMTRTILAL